MTFPVSLLLASLLMIAPFTHVHHLHASDVQVSEIQLPGEAQRPQAIVLASDGNLWVTEVLKHQIFRITPEGRGTAFPVPGENVGVLQGLTHGPDGNLWFTSREENAIRRMTLNGEFTGTFVIPSTAKKPTKFNQGSWPRGITSGPDGQLWFAEMAADKIASLSVDGKFTEYDVPTADCGAYGIVTGPDQNIWFTESNSGKIGRLTLSTGTIDEFALSDPQSRPRDITVGPDGRLWFSENGSDRIGAITMEGQITEYDLPKETKPIGIAAGGDGQVWFTCFKTHKLGRISADDGRITFFDLKTPDAQPFGMTTGPNGEIWATLQANGVARVITTSAP